MSSFSRTIPLIGILTAAALAIAASPAQAAPTFCSAVGGNTDGLATSDMKLNQISADDCYGVLSGNLTPTQLTTLANNTAVNPGLTWGGGWIFADGTDTSESGVLSGLAFAVTATIGVSGSWTLSITDTNGPDPLNLPTSLDFIGALKSSTSTALYFFDDILVDTSNDGTYNITFLNASGKNFGALSHLDLLVREGAAEPPELCPDGSTPPCVEPPVLPEPGSLSLLGLGLAGLAAFRRRRPV